MKDKRFNFYDIDKTAFDYKNAKDRAILNLIRKFEDFEYYCFESERVFKHAMVFIGFAYAYIIAQIIRWIIC